jgi:ornithine cyclodeaminase/alanine dehydrogenase-like protein (mu-crystallin family)
MRAGAICAEVVIGVKPGRVDRDEITLFKSVGMATEDISTACFAYRHAMALGVGTPIELDVPAFSQPCVV